MAQTQSGHRLLASDGSREVAIALLIFAAAMAYFQRTLHLTFELRDEGFLLYHIARVAAGEVPHRDFAQDYPPGIYLLTAPIYAWFGERVMPIRELLAGIRAVAVVLAYLISRRLVPRPFALLAAAFALAYWGWPVWNLSTPYAALFTIPLGMLSVYLLLVAQARKDPRFELAAGLVCGLGLLFKWSLAAMTAYGSVVAICGLAMIQSRGVDQSKPGGLRGRAPALVVWTAIALLLLVPFLSRLSAFDYLLHFGPVHALMGVVALAFARRGSSAAAFAAAVPRVARYSVGFVVTPILTFALYGAWGHADDLFYNTVVRPLHYRNYDLSVPMPSLSDAATLVSGVSLSAACLAGLGRKPRLAVGLAAMTALFVTLGSGTDGLRASEDALHRLLLHLPTLTAYATVVLLAVDLAPGRDRARDVPALLVALLFQMMMSFQIYPRAGYNIILMIATIAPTLAYLAFRATKLALSSEMPVRPTRRALAFVAAALLPLLLMHVRVAEVLAAPQPDALSEQHFRHASFAGIHPEPHAWTTGQLAAFDTLVERLEALQPADAPLFVVPNESMIYFASAREPLFEDAMLIFFLAGWNTLPDADPAMPTAQEIASRFEAQPDAIVITRPGDETAAALFATFPQLRAYLARHYREIERVGPYRVLRRSAAAGERR